MQTHNYAGSSATAAIINRGCRPEQSLEEIPPSINSHWKLKPNSWEINQNFQGRWEELIGRRMPDVETGAAQCIYIILSRSKWLQTMSSIPVEECNGSKTLLNKKLHFPTIFEILFARILLHDGIFSISQRHMSYLIWIIRRLTYLSCVPSQSSRFILPCPSDLYSATRAAVTTQCNQNAPRTGPRSIRRPQPRRRFQPDTDLPCQREQTHGCMLHARVNSHLLI